MGFDLEKVYVLSYTGIEPYEGEVVAGVVEGFDVYPGGRQARYRYLNLSGAGMGGSSVVGDIVEERPDGTIVVESAERPTDTTPPIFFTFSPLTINIWRQKMAAGEISKVQGEAYSDTGTLQTAMNLDIVTQSWREEAAEIIAAASR